MSLSYRSARKVDLPLLFLSIILLTIGLMFVFSATYLPEQPYSLFIKKQLLGAVIGVLIFLFFSLVNYHTIIKYGYFAYFILIGLLAFTIIKGSIGMGAQRWINLGFFKLQPSELCKLLFPTYLGYFIYTAPSHELFLKDFLKTVSMLLISYLLILKQPDLGTTILVAASASLLLYAAKFKRIYLKSTAIVACITLPFGWYILKPYQKQRILVFFGQGQSNNERYHIEQSIIAIGSGGLTGKGFMQGTQNILQFLPESRTDFIFAVIAEELGFIGASTILLLYLLLIFRLLYMIIQVKNHYACIIMFGLTAHILFSIYINIGMTTGMLPVVGIPLTLISYGLTNLWVALASLGLCSGIYMQETPRNRVL